MPYFNTSKLPVAIIIALGLSGCSTVQGLLGIGSDNDDDDFRQPLAQREQLEPLESNYFALPSTAESVVGEPQIVFSREEDTFSDLARTYGLGYDELVAANPGIDPWLPGAGTPILLPTQFILPAAPREGVVLNIAVKRLFYYPKPADGEAAQVITFPIGIGRVGWETPTGGTKVVAKAKDPAWYVPASVRKEHREAGDPLPAIVPPGPDNPLGEFVLKLGMPGYLIHGTNQPYGVGMRVSHGCVRLYPENIETLYPQVGIGTQVMIVNQPYLAGTRNGELYFEAHTPLEEDTVAADTHLEEIFERLRNQSGAFAETDEQNLARGIADVANGMPMRLLRRDADEILGRARLVKNTVQTDPDAPTLSEVRELLDAG